MVIQSQLIKGKFFTIIILLFCFSFPFGMLLNNIFYGLLILFCLLCFSIKQIKQNIYSSLITILFCIFFISLTFSLIYTENIEYGLKILLRLSPFIIFPLIILTFSEYLNKDLLNKCLNFFTLGVYVSILICLLFGVYQTYLWGAYNPLDESNGNFFSYFNLTDILRIHPIYFGCYVLLSISYLFTQIVQGKMITKQKKGLIIFGILSLIIFTFLLNSFMLIIILGILLVVFFVYCIKNKIGLNWIILLFIFSIYPTYKASYFLQEKLKGINIVEDFTTRDYSGEDFTAIKARNAKATLSIFLIKENILLGTGIGDSKDELLKVYKDYGFVHGVQNQFNSHNQYLTTFIGLGIIGFSTLLFSILVMYYEAFLFKNYMLLNFIIIISLFMLTESILERQAGIMFYTFFSILLSFNYKNKTDTSEK